MKGAILNHLSPGAKLLFVILLMIVCFITVSLIGIVLAIPFFHVNLFADFSMMGDIEDPGKVGLLKYLQIVQSIGLFVVPVLLAAYFFSPSAWSYFGFERKPSAVTFFAALLIMFAALPFINWLTTLNEAMTLPESWKGLEQWMTTMEDQATTITEAFLKTNSIGGLFVNLLLIAIVPAIGEELFFRGMLQRLFGELFKNAHVAIGITALLFSVIHMQFYGFVPRFFLGLILGYLYYFGGSLWVPILAHFVNNGGAVLVAYLTSRGYTSIDYEQFGSTSNGFLIGFSLFLTSGFLFLVYRRGLNR